MVTVVTVYDAGALHQALTQAGLGIDGVSTSPSGTVVHCAGELASQVADFLATYQDPAPPAPAPTVDELQAQIIELQNALLDLLIGGA